MYSGSGTGSSSLDFAIFINDTRKNFRMDDPTFSDDPGGVHMTQRASAFSLLAVLAAWQIASEAGLAQVREARVWIEGMA